jgi:CDP-glycerol glycerophosphotransferase (TagB/SpsB family)
MTYIFPKNNKIWIFKGFADKYIDNSKYLFEYINQNRKDIYCIWITDNKETLNYLKNTGNRVYLRWSIKGIYYSLRAKVVFYGDYTDVLTTNGAIWVNLWHGVPLKKIEHDIRTGSLSKYYDGKMAKKIQYMNLYRKPDYIISSSEFISKNCFSSAFRIDVNRCLNFGFSRNDYLENFNKNKISCSYLKKIIHKLETYNNVYLYLPTWRDGDFDLIKEADIDLNDLNKKMIELKSVMLLKFHPASKIMVDINNFSNIILLDNNIDLYQLIPFSTTLITDYSSVYFDYLLTGKPIIFFPFDYDDYIKSRNFYFNYYEFITLNIVYSFNELLDQLDKIKVDTSLYNDIKKLAWKSPNEMASKLILEYFINKLEVDK